MPTGSLEGRLGGDGEGKGLEFVFTIMIIQSYHSLCGWELRRYEAEGGGGDGGGGGGGRSGCTVIQWDRLHKIGLV